MRPAHVAITFHLSAPMLLGSLARILRRIPTNSILCPPVAGQRYDSFIPCCRCSGEMDSTPVATQPFLLYTSFQVDAARSNSILHPPTTARRGSRAG